MTFARLLLEIRRRATSLPNDLAARVALEQAAREVLETAGEQREPARKIMAALLGIGGEQDFDAGVLDALTPETVLRLDLIADQMLMARPFRFTTYSNASEEAKAVNAAAQLRAAVGNEQFIERVVAHFPATNFSGTQALYRSDMEGFLQHQAGFALLFFLYAVVPPALLYGLGLLVAWVRAGFKPPA